MSMARRQLNCLQNRRRRILPTVLWWRWFWGLLSLLPVREPFPCFSPRGLPSVPSLERLLPHLHPAGAPQSHVLTPGHSLHLPRMTVDLTPVCLSSLLGDSDKPVES